MEDLAEGIRRIDLNRITPTSDQTPASTVQSNAPEPVMDETCARIIGEAVAKGLRTGLAIRDDHQKPKEFKGSRKIEDVFIFIEEVGTHGQREGCDLNSKLLTKYASRYLAGNALMWYNIAKSDYEKMSCPEFKEALKQHYLAPNFNDSTAMQLIVLKQTTSVRRYAEKFTRLLRYVKEPWTNPTILKPFMYHSVKPAVKVGILKAVHDEEVSVGAFLNVAQEVDEALFVAAGNKGQPPPRQFDGNRGGSFEASTFSPGPLSSTGLELDQDGDTVMSLAVMKPKKLTQRERAELIKSHGCFACRRIGRRSMKCPFKGHFNRNQPADRTEHLN
ncbi:hypothetical protein Cantr_10254 [Candida viswanathii]|uniref:Retrotransposon gag domain-containing protein n=1 Tax=Candida viswanathii TaxID=5486 RepID=A0A367YE03_9ASCO|nr:hypothetical protein Cantr_10254 [Candida viswanathii]